MTSYTNSMHGGNGSIISITMDMGFGANKANSPPRAGTRMEITVSPSHTQHNLRAYPAPATEPAPAEATTPGRHDSPGEAPYVAQLDAIMGSADVEHRAAMAPPLSPWRAAYVYKDGDCPPTGAAAAQPDEAPTMRPPPGAQPTAWDKLLASPPKFLPGNARRNIHQDDQDDGPLIWDNPESDEIDASSDASSDSTGEMPPLIDVDPGHPLTRTTNRPPSQAQDERNDELWTSSDDEDNTDDVEQDISFAVSPPNVPTAQLKPFSVWAPIDMALRQLEGLETAHAKGWITDEKWAAARESFTDNFGSFGPAKDTPTPPADCASELLPVAQREAEAATNKTLLAACAKHNAMHPEIPELERKHAQISEPKRDANRPKPPPRVLAQQLKMLAISNPEPNGQEKKKAKTNSTGKTSAKVITKSKCLCKPKSRASRAGKRNLWSQRIPNQRVTIIDLNGQTCRPYVCNIPAWSGLLPEGEAEWRQTMKDQGALGCSGCHYNWRGCAGCGGRQWKPIDTSLYKGHKARSRSKTTLEKAAKAMREYRAAGKK